MPTREDEFALEPLLVRHEHAMRAIGYRDSHYWGLVRAGEIETVGTGKRGRAVWSSVRQYVNRLRAEKAATGPTPPPPNIRRRAKEAEAQAGEAA